MTDNSTWHCSIHARKRLAKRLGLILDQSAVAEISKALDAKYPKLVGGNKDRLMVEIKVFGKAIVAVCSMVDKVVITFVPAKQPFKKRNCRPTRSNGFRPKGSSGSEEE